MLDRFDGVYAQVLGISVDSVACLKAWAESLGGITYPLLSDFYPHGAVAEEYGVLRYEGYSERALFVIDKEGIIRYADVHDIDDQPDNDVLLRVLEELEPASGLRKDPAVKEMEPLHGAESATITLYCTPWCPACRRAREYLKGKGVSFSEVDISRDREAASRVRGWANGNETTPTFDIQGRIVVDFKKDQLDLVFKELTESKSVQS
jgi:glutaredoxin